VADLGDGVLPCMSRESALLQRNLTYMSGAPTRIIESTFSGHPSRRMSEFVHGFVSTLDSSRSPVQFVQEEASRHIGLFDSSWSSFTASLGSIAELSYMVRGEGGVRYVEEVVEAGGEWRTMFRHGPASWEGDAAASVKLEKRGSGFGFSDKRISFELDRRVAFLERVVGRGVSDYSALSRELRQFYLSSSLTF
jgi:hypothetical protein